MRLKSSKWLKRYYDGEPCNHNSVHDAMIDNRAALAILSAPDGTGAEEQARRLVAGWMSPDDGCFETAVADAVAVLRQSADSAREKALGEAEGIARSIEHEWDFHPHDAPTAVRKIADAIAALGGSSRGEE